MRARCVLAEVGRLLGRRWPILSVAAVALLAGLFALAAAFDLRRVDHLSFVYCFVPVFLLPVGARMAARDIDRGLTAVLATASTSATERLAAQVAAMALLASAWTAAAVPSWAVLFAPAGSLWSAEALRPLAWGLVIGLSSGLTGLLIGALSGARATLALTLAFVLAFVWILLPANGTTLIAVVDPVWLKRLVIDLMHLSPVMWGLDELGFFWIAPAADAPPLLLAGGLFVVAPLVCLALVVLGAQHVARWHLTRHGASMAGVALVVLSASVVGLSSWPFPVEPPGPEQWSNDAEGEGFRLGVAVQSSSMQRGRVALAEGEELLLRLSFVGQANRTLDVTDVRVTSEQAAFRPVSGPPGQVVLDELIPSHGDDGPVGQKQIVTAFVVTPRYVDGSLVPLSVLVEVDGIRHEVQVAMFPSVPAAPAWIAAVTAAVVISLLAVGAYLPWRWNRW